jgi:L-alanine-DL-glutamate epimerase-like enolase superfamily enzyme
MQTMDLLSPFSEAAALECCRLGFAGQKWRILASDLQDDETLDRMISVICKFKANVGREHMLMVDSQRTWTASLGHRFIQALPANVLAWIEDAPPELVKDASDQGVGPHKPSFAAGETWHGLARFERAISSGCYSVIQPDAYVCGGVSVMIAIAKRCAEGSVIFAPHGRTFVESMIASEVACVRDQTLYEFNPILEPLRQSPFGRKCSNLLKVN